MNVGFLSSIAVAQLAQPQIDHTFWDWMESNGALVYPALAVGVVALITGALVANWRGDGLTTERRGQLKMQIIRILTRRVAGATSDTISSDLGLLPETTTHLLKELVEERRVVAFEGTGSRKQLYRIRRPTE